MESLKMLLKVKVLYIEKFNWVAKNLYEDQCPEDFYIYLRNFIEFLGAKIDRTFSIKSHKKPQLTIIQH